MPVYFPGYAVPTRGATSPGYLSYAGVMVNKVSTSVNVTGIPTYNQMDGKGPRIDTCCLPGVDCLTTDPVPGWYQTSATRPRPCACLLTRAVSARGCRGGPAGLRR